MLTWQIASPEEFTPICDLFSKSELGTGFAEVKRRISAPLLFRQLITFYKDSKLCGFVTFAFLNADAESHMPKEGIHLRDWRSGNAFWVVDFAANKGSDGYAMLRTVTKALGIKKARYFHKKKQIIKEVRPICLAME